MLNPTCYFSVFLVSIVSCFYENNSNYEPKWIYFLNNQKKLMSDLFDGYDNSVSPVYSQVDPSKPLGYDLEAPKRFNYTLFLYFVKLVEVVEPEEKVTLVLEISEAWFDPRLAWEANSYNGINTLYVRQEKVWSPTLNSYKVNDMNDLRDQDFRIVSIDSSGRVNTTTSLRMSINCPLNKNINFKLMLQLNVGLTNIMTMTFILGVMADKIPKTGSIPLLGIHIVVNLFITVAAVAVTVFIEKIKKVVLPRLRKRKGLWSYKLEGILEDWMDIICMIVLETISCVNFFIIIGFWIANS